MENYDIFQHFMQDRIQNPMFFFHELFPLLKFSDTSFIFIYDKFAEESLTAYNCKAMVVVFKMQGFLHCYTFAPEGLEDIDKSITYFLQLFEKKVPLENIIIHDSTEMGSFYECINRMKEQVVANGLYFPSGFAEMLPDSDYKREDFLDKFFLEIKYDLDKRNFDNFFLLFFNLRFKDQVTYYLFDLEIDIEKMGVNRLEIKYFKKSFVYSENPRFLVFICTKIEKNGDNPHSTNILIDRKLKNIVSIDSAIYLALDKKNGESLSDLKIVLENILLEQKIIDITMYTIQESIISILNYDYLNIPVPQQLPPPPQQQPSRTLRPTPKRDFTAPSIMYLQVMFEEKGYKNYCLFLSWWMLFIILKLNEYNWRSFTQIAGEDLNKLVEEKNEDFIGYIYHLVLKTIQDPEYEKAFKENNYIVQQKIIKKNFIVKNVLNRNEPASRFGYDSKKLSLIKKR